MGVGEIDEKWQEILGANTEIIGSGCAEAGRMCSGQ
jgi:hypothetical protein